MVEETLIISNFLHFIIYRNQSWFCTTTFWLGLKAFSCSEFPGSPRISLHEGRAPDPSQAHARATCMISVWSGPFERDQLATASSACFQMIPGWCLCSLHSQDFQLSPWPKSKTFIGLHISTMNVRGTKTTEAQCVPFRAVYSSQRFRRAR